VVDSWNAGRLEPFPRHVESGSSGKEGTLSPRASAWILQLLVAVGPFAGPLPSDTPAAKAAGLELRALEAKDLDALQAATGHRVGVLVTAVAAGSPAAKGDLRVDDLLIGVAGAKVDSPEAVEAAFAGKAGRVEAALLRRGAAGYEAIPASMDLPAAKPPGAEAAPEGRKGTTYRHPIGFTFWHPSDWTVQDRGDCLLLVPPSPGGTAAEPTEAYLVASESVAGTGIVDPADPRVAGHFDAQVRALAPFLRREGKAEPGEMARGRGAVLDWKGSNPRGDAVRARAFTAILEEHGVALVALGLEERVAARDADLRRMFATFGLGAGDRDGTIVGAWDLVSTYALRNDSSSETAATRASSVSETQSRIVLRADGTFTRTDVSQTIVIGAGVSLDSGPERKVRQGKWNAGNGSLYLHGSDDLWMAYRYRLQQDAGGARLRLESEGRGELWQPAR
jgi:hypothetical protein